MLRQLLMRLLLKLKAMPGDVVNADGGRSSRLRLSVISSLSGKGISIITQLFAIPVAISALGVEKFGLYAILSSLLVWVNTATVVISSSLTVKLVSAHAQSDFVEEGKIFSTGFLFSIGIAVVLLFGLQTGSHIIDVNKLLVANSENPGSEFQDAFRILSILVSSNIVFGMAEAAQAGYQRQYINNALLSIGNIFTIAGLLVVVKSSPSVPNMIMVMFAPVAVSRVINTFILFKSHPHILPSFSKFKIIILKSMFITGAAFSLTQVGAFIYQNLTIIIVGKQFGAASAGYMSVMMLIVSILGSLLTLFTQPLWPAVQDALHRNDFKWIARTYKAAISRLTPYIIAAALVIVVFGEQLLKHWIKAPLPIDGVLQVLWGSFFLIVAWEHINYTFMIGLGKLWIAAVSYFAGSLISLVLIFTYGSSYGVIGIFSAMCAGPLFLSSWLYPIILRRQIHFASSPPRASRMTS